MLREECVEFPNDKGLLLRGVLHLADTAKRRGVSIICLNTGLNDMVGWHRLQVKIARFLAEYGYDVLRFNNFGIGESEGEIQEGNVFEIFEKIEKGLWANDASCGLEYMMKKFDNSGKYLFMGYCGGALNAIHAAANDTRLHGIINIAAPITLSTETVAKRLDPWNVQKSAEIYKKKFFRWRTIKNFFTGKSDYKKAFLTITYLIRYKITGEYPARNPSESETEKTRLKDNVNLSLFKSFDKYSKSNRPILFYYAEHDVATWELKQYFIPKYGNTKFWKKYCKVIEIQKANHIFSDQETQQQMKEDLYNWLELNNF
ncbi:MAG: alpha/beta hydrolase [Candidatus Cloacimonadia bacterium]